MSKSCSNCEHPTHRGRCPFLIPHFTPIDVTTLEEGPSPTLFNKQRCDCRFERCFGCAVVHETDRCCRCNGGGWVGKLVDGEVVEFCYHCDAKHPPSGRVPHTRQTLYTRIADVLKRSGVEDGEQLVRDMERDRREICQTLESARFALEAPGSRKNGNVFREIDRALATDYPIGPTTPSVFDD